MTRTVSHYRIVRELGRGGMGIVYLAEDTRLRRMVALKLLAPEVARDPRRRQRFLREAHAASIMTHPNIAVIHEVAGSDEETPFIAMEYVEGETLQATIGNKPMELSRILDIGMEVADALDEAHGRGVIHRDLKPANIIINTRGAVKVLDFGLARIVREPAPGTDGPTSLMSEPGLILGTIHYMSPEQALGREVDVRSDLFSFGVILYEMATGRRPFEGGSSTEIIEKIVHQQPEAVARLNYDAPEDLERIIRKCLEKDRQSRYQSAREVMVDLKNLRRDSSSGEYAKAATAPSRPRKLAVTVAAIIVAVIAIGTFLMMRRLTVADVASGTADDPVVSIAVLPFSTMTAAEEGYLQFALPDELITILSYNPSVAVRPFGTTRRLVAADPIEAGRNLKVDKVVTGSYRSERGELAVTVEAIDVTTNRVVWRDTIDGSPEALIALRGALASRVRAGLLPALGVSEVAAESAQPNNAEAYSLYLRAVGMSTDPQPTRQALELLQRAVTLEPGFAPAWAHMAIRHYYDAHYGGGGVAAGVAARAAARRALEVDPDYMDPARSLIVYDTEAGDLPSAYERARRLLRRNPRIADGHFVVSYVLRYGGRLQDAARECERARGIQPFRGLRSCAMVYESLGNYERARDFLRLDEGSQWAALQEIRLLLKEGKAPHALALLQEHESLDAERLRACANKQPGNSSLYEGIESLALDSEARYSIAEMAACGGNTEHAMRLLREALEHGYSIYPVMETNPFFEPLRRDPRWPSMRTDAIRYHDEISRRFAEIERS